MMIAGRHRYSPVANRKSMEEYTCEVDDVFNHVKRLSTHSC